MSFLAPLYILGALAVSLPVLFHLFRRTPRGHVSFSSLMFLAPSPPRITRRSRLDNVFLLILRASIICLLALAFGRPFPREAAHLNLGGQKGRRVAILLDTSASMRRAGLWSRATTRVEKVLDDVGPGDRLAFFTFDDELRKVVDFDDEVEAPPAGRAARTAMGGCRFQPRKAPRPSRPGTWSDDGAQERPRPFGRDTCGPRLDADRSPGRATPGGTGAWMGRDPRAALPERSRHATG